MSPLPTTYLFIIAPNNSGSTLLRNLIAANAPCMTLLREGQHVPGFVGPSTRGTGTRLIWASRQEWIDQFRDPNVYDWSQTRKAWQAQADVPQSSNGTPKPVFVTSSPPFLLIVDQLRTHFPEARFVFLTRHPLAAIEGIIRRAHQQPLDKGDNIAEVAAQHMGYCLTMQTKNIERHSDVSIALRYEDLCAAPDNAAQRISDLVPALGDLRFHQRVSVKGEPPRPIIDRNEQQISRLTVDELTQIKGSGGYLLGPELSALGYDF